MTATVVPITESHKDGKAHLTDQGWVIWLPRRQGWYVSDDCDSVLSCADEGPFVSDLPTVVITLTP